MKCGRGNLTRDDDCTNFSFGALRQVNAAQRKYFIVAESAKNAANIYEIAIFIRKPKDSSRHLTVKALSGCLKRKALWLDFYSPEKYLKFQY